MTDVRPESESILLTVANANGKDTAPPAYFLSLKIANFRCFGPEQTLDLSDGNGRPAHWTILLGENGVGKTTLLQWLAAIQPQVDRRFGEEKYSLPKYVPAVVSNFMSEYWDMKSRDIDQNSYSAARFWYGLLAEDIAPSKTVDVHLVFHNVENNIYWRNYTTLSMTDLPSGSASCFGYGAMRRSHDGLYIVPALKNGPYDTLFEDNVALPKPDEWLIQVDYAAKLAKNGKASRSRSRKEKIEKLLAGGILPDVSAFRYTTTNDNAMTPRVEAKTPYGWVRVGDLSLGYKTALTWMVDLAARLFDRYPDSPNPLAEPAVVLVDEIDLHLHPKWQRDLIALLTKTFPNTQFIVTAHSPLIVQAAGSDANIAVLRREGDHVVIDNNPENVRNWRVDQVLTSVLFGLETARPPQLEEAFQERTQLLSKQRLTAKDKKRLTELDAIIGELPIGETSDDRRAADLLKRAAAALTATTNGA